MDEVSNAGKLIDYLSNYKFTNISNETRFWIIRTKKGYFYNEFLINKYIALGWNTIDNHTDIGVQSLEPLKQRIASEYNEKVPMTAINKCINFMHSIKEGDILIIPSAGSKYITFARAGEYYEVLDKTYEIERDIISKIDSDQVMIKEVECPYKKRHKITILKTIKHDNLNVRLARAFSSYHGISNLDAYSELILDSIYDNYIYGNKMLLQFNVTKTKPIKPREITNLMYGLTEYLCSIIDEDYIFTSINLNSPGKVKITIESVTEKLKQDKWYWLILFVLITGGKAFTFEFPGLVHTIKEIVTVKDEIAIMQLERENKEIDNTMKKVELSRMLDETGIDTAELLSYLDTILDVSDSLEIQPEKTILIPDDTELQLILPEENELDD